MVHPYEVWIGNERIGMRESENGRGTEIGETGSASGVWIGTSEG